MLRVSLTDLYENPFKLWKSLKIKLSYDYKNNNELQTKEVRCTLKYSSYISLI